MSDEGIATFSKIAASSAFFDRMKGDNVMFVVEYEGNIELNEERHIVILFVTQNVKRKVLVGLLLLFALEYAKVDVVTVSASLSSVPAYVKYGFKFNDDTGISAGLVYQPMKIELILSHYNQL